MLDKKRAALAVVGFVLVVIALEVLALQLGSLELNLANTPPVAENP